MRVSHRIYHSEAQLAELEHPAASFERACCLEDLGRPEDATAAYKALLAREPGHFGALTNLGLMLLDGDARVAARPYLVGAVAARSADPAAYLNLARLERDDGDTEAALRAYEQALKLDAENVEAQLGLGILYEAEGDDERAALHFARAFAKPVCWMLPFRGERVPVRVLVLASARGGDLVTNIFLDDTVFQTYVFAVETYREALPLPDHDLILNGIGDADRAGDALALAKRLAAASGAPIVNDPARVRTSGRVENATRFAALDDTVVPRVERLGRDQFDAETLARRGWHFPFLLRAPGFHAGRHFVRVDDAHGLARVLERLPKRELFAISFIDVRSADGYVRKYRVLFVGGTIYPMHVAIATHWKVHAFSADAPGELQRREERDFLADPSAVLGARAMRAVNAIGDMLGLDYGGLDFSLDAKGHVVVFEANATMAVYQPPDTQLSARRDASLRIVNAMRSLLLERARPRRIADG